MGATAWMPQMTSVLEVASPRRWNQRAIKVALSNNHFFQNPLWKANQGQGRTQSNFVLQSCETLRWLTPAEAQKSLAYESWPHLSNDSQVGLPRLCQHPAEGRQKEEMQEGSGHSAEALQRKNSQAEQEDETAGDVVQKK